MERLELLKRNLLNSKFQCVKLDGAKIGLALTEDALNNVDVVLLGNGSFFMNEIPFIISKDINCILDPRRISKHQKLKESLQAILIKKELWHEDLDSEIPSSWEKYGDLILFNGTKYFKSAVWCAEGPDLWPSVCRILNGKRIALKSHILPDGFRTPNVHMVWGNSSWVEYVDNGISYSWDATKNMFCAGNAPERHRIAKLKCDNEVVVDLYAGIGYFTLPFLVLARAQLVHACEWNPAAVNALRKNLVKNNVSDRCIVHEGDNEKERQKTNLVLLLHLTQHFAAHSERDIIGFETRLFSDQWRKVQLSNVADRVNLGLLPSSQAGWRIACKALKSTGGTLHIHENVTTGIKRKALESENKTDAENIPLDQCVDCRQILNHANSNAYLEKHFQRSFFLQSGAFFASRSMNWKKQEWKIWALHVSHCIFKILCEVHTTGITWKVSVVNIHHVKSYAPHVDHLVLDIHCQSCPS